MKLNLNTKWVDGIEHIHSPNFDDRPVGIEPEVLIIHAISLPPGCYGEHHIEALFCNHLDTTLHPYFESLQGLEVSSHFLIRRNGSAVQFVGLDKRAWHAGMSSCLGRERVNDFSIGIELEGCDDEGFEPVQYEVLDSLIGLLMKRFPIIDRSRIFGHSEIAPGRKTDPGPYFDWSRIR